MAITFDYSDSSNHIQDLVNEVKTLIDIDYDSINMNNIDAIRSAAKGIEEPTRSKVFNMLNFIVFNSQINSVYGYEQ